MKNYPGLTRSETEIFIQLMYLNRDKATAKDWKEFMDFLKSREKE